MKGTINQNYTTLHRLTFTLLAILLLFTLTGFSPQPQSSNTDGSSVFSCIFILLWILSVWYWYRHNKIRGRSVIFAIIFSVILSGISVLAMIIDAPLRAIFSKQEFGPCPNCGKTKLIRENPSQAEHIALPQCPHCKTFVGPEIAGAPVSISISRQIEELQELLDKNIITQEEFEKKKTELLDRM